MSDRTDDELADRVADLEETLEELRDELEPSRGPLGLPRPPTPREVLRFTDRYAIPAAIAILEANIRTLELLRAVLRGARGAPREEEVRARASSIGRTTVDRVDRALADLQTAMEDADLPRNDGARSLLSEAKDLNREIRDALDAGEPRTDDAKATTADVEAPGREVEPTENDGDPDDGGSTVEIDVDAELASIRDELDEEDDTGNGNSADSTGDDDDLDGRSGDSDG